MPHIPDNVDQLIEELEQFVHQQLNDDEWLIETLELEEAASQKWLENQMEMHANSQAGADINFHTCAKCKVANVRKL